MANQYPKITYEFVKRSFEDVGYQLLSTEYISNHRDLEYVCPNGHKHKISWHDWRIGVRCGVCDRKYISYDEIKQSFESVGYQLLSTEYQTAHSYLEYICPNGHKHKISWHNWQQGKRCGRCFGNIKVTYKQVKQSFLDEGYQLLSTEYKNAQTYLNFICTNGHKHKIIWANWQQGQRCGRCKPKWSKPEKEILKYIYTIYNGIIIPNDRSMIRNPITGKYLELDIWLPEIRKAIEYNSIYYHRDKIKDDYKQQWCKENNIDLLIINDDKWRKHKDFNIIQTFING